MRYADSKCAMVVGPEETKIVGPFVDRPGTVYTVVVKTADLEKYRKGEVRYVQNAFPYLSADEREFLISGMSPEGWDKMFPPDDEDE